MNPKDYKTKTYIAPRLNPSCPEYWIVGIDVGYSAVKVFSPNMVASFPNFAKAVPYGTADNMLGASPRSCIAYRDNAGHEFFVGEKAQEGTRATDADNSTASLYIRDRYYSAEFKAISEVGIALAISTNQYGSPKNKKLFVQTGLPSEYTSDAPDLIASFVGEHEFDVKFGDGEWKHYSFTLTQEDIGVMPQPMGTLVSISTDNSGNQVSAAKDYYDSNLLIVDIGFGTLDTLEISGHIIRSAPKTWNNLGMLRVFEETAKLIKQKCDGLIVPVPTMQKILQDGVFRTKFQRATRHSEEVEIAPFLKEANDLVVKEAITAIDGFYNFLQDEKYVVITGGTGEAWYPDFVKAYEDSPVVIMKGNVNDTIPIIYTNARGYFMQAYNTLKRKSAA